MALGLEAVAQFTGSCQCHVQVISLGPTLVTWVGALVTDSADSVDIEWCQPVLVGEKPHSQAGIRSKARNQIPALKKFADEPWW
jgi:hypothetical protein